MADTQPQHQQQQQQHTDSQQPQHPLAQQSGGAAESARQTDANNNEPPPQYYDSKSGQAQQQGQQQQAPPGQAQPAQPRATVPLHMLGDGPQWIDCPFCHHQSQTIVTKRGTDMQTIAGVILCCFCVCLACLPCIAGWCEDREYRCNHCNNLVAVHPDGGAIQIFTPAGPAPIAVPVQHHYVPQPGQKMQQPAMQPHPQQPAPTHQQGQNVQQQYAPQEQSQGIEVVAPPTTNHSTAATGEKATQ